MGSYFYISSPQDAKLQNWNQKRRGGALYKPTFCDLFVMETFSLVSRGGGSLDFVFFSSNSIRNQNQVVDKRRINMWRKQKICIMFVNGETVRSNSLLLAYRCSAGFIDLRMKCVLLFTHLLNLCVA